MDATEISPRPWRMEAIDADPEGGVDYAVLDASGNTVVEGMSEANALLIVEAVNAKVDLCPKCGGYGSRIGSEYVEECGSCNGTGSLLAHIVVPDAAR
jgi:hypothetical protein